jgi:hypothetical protein
MTDEVLETFIRQLIETHRSREVTVAWQGGEPILMGVDFCRRANEPMQMIAMLMRMGRPASEIMAIRARREGEWQATLARARPEDACPCGSGLRFGQCHGWKRPDHGRKQNRPRPQRPRPRVGARLNP